MGVDGWPPRRAARCDRLILLRGGQVLTDCTYPELLTRTGAADADGAFLALIDAQPATGDAGEETA